VVRWPSVPTLARWRAAHLWSMDVPSLPR